MNQQKWGNDFRKVWVIQDLQRCSTGIRNYFFPAAQITKFVCNLGPDCEYFYSRTLNSWHTGVIYFTFTFLLFFICLTSYVIILVFQTNLNNSLLFNNNMYSTFSIFWNYGSSEGHSKAYASRHLSVAGVVHDSSFQRKSEIKEWEEGVKTEDFKFFYISTHLWPDFSWFLCQQQKFRWSLILITSQTNFCSLHKNQLKSGHKLVEKFVVLGLNSFFSHFNDALPLKTWIMYS
jgi:hypothetical protein